MDKKPLIAEQHADVIKRMQEKFTPDEMAQLIFAICSTLTFLEGYSLTMSSLLFLSESKGEPLKDIVKRWIEFSEEFNTKYQQLKKGELN